MKSTVQVLITITFKNIVNTETYKHFFRIYYTQDCKYTNKCDQEQKHTMRNAYNQVYKHIMKNAYNQEYKYTYN